MLRGRRALIDVVKHCWALRPFILSNESFRHDLVRLAASNELLLRGEEGGDYARNYEVS